LVTEHLYVTEILVQFERSPTKAIYLLCVPGVFFQRYVCRAR